ncbi:MAG: GxxExxY protein [Prevotella sp.]|nr:GxxExxY protein [Prevotella sp.]
MDWNESITLEYTHRLLACAYAVHTALGPGLLESIYEKALTLELHQNGFQVETQVPMKVMYKGVDLGCDMRLDLLIDHQVIIEIKSVQELKPVHYKQLLTYMRLMDVKLGFLINFDVSSLKDGIHRVVF